MLDQLDALQQKAFESLEALTDLTALEAWHGQYLSRRGELTQLLRSVGQLAREERPAAGRRANEFKTALEAAYERRQADLKRQARVQALASEQVDVTLPGRAPSLGRLHLSTQALRRIYAIFADMGFQVYRAPDVETDELNWTHTSPGQIRAMRDYCPEPIRVILPGMCYRYEQVTARSEMMFYQVEGLAVGKQITMTDLKGTMVEYARRMFGADRKMRFRASYFPFTEPSVEVDMDCILCGGEGCRVCKYTGWLEIAGAGMVHPVVLRNGGYDPEVYSGFAFGMGVERPAMLIHGIDDIRSFFGNDLRFLEQF
jgi:phenylalanyl-tRNA synthetase alpha chain